jgi:hypothetical protein
MLRRGEEHVADDPWIGTTWKVYAVQGADGCYLKPNGIVGVFTLTAVPGPDVGPAIYYTVDFVDGYMPPCWQGLVLYPRGNLPFEPPSPLLPPWTPSGESAWQEDADAVTQGLNVAMARLEGDLYPETNAKGLTLVCVPNATTTGTPLLVLKLVSAMSDDGKQPMDNPTGGGYGDH